MNHGVIEQIDTPHNIYYKPQTQFVAKFIGTMNFKSHLRCTESARGFRFYSSKFGATKLKAGKITVLVLDQKLSSWLIISAVIKSRYICQLKY